MTATPETFHGNRQEVAVRADTTKTRERGEMVFGRLEINTPDILDESGQVVTQGDRWFVECSVTIQPRPAKLVVTERESPDAPPILLTGRRGQAATGTLHLRNAGEVAAEFTVGPKTPQAGLTVTPAEGSLEPGKSVEVVVRAPTEGMASGSYPTALTVRRESVPEVTVPLALHILSPLEALKSVLKMK